MTLQIPNFISLNKGEPQYIAIEGPDGAGKTTYLNKLYLEVSKYRDDVILVSEPGTTTFAKALRTILKDPNIERSHLGEIFAIFAARADLITNLILPSIKEGKLILSDRCFISTLVYQSLRYGDVIDPFVIHSIKLFFEMVSIEKNEDINKLYPSGVILLNPKLEMIFRNLNKRDGGVIKDGLYEACDNTIRKLHKLYQEIPMLDMGVIKPAFCLVTSY